MGKGNSKTLLTPVFRMAFPNFIEPKQITVNGKPQGDHLFTATCIFDPADLDKFQVPDPQDPNKLTNVNIAKVVAELCRAEWPGIDLNAEMGQTWPIVDGDKYAAKQEAKQKSADAYKGKKLINVKAKSDYPPSLYAVVDGKLTQLNRQMPNHIAVARSVFIGGYYAIAEVNVSPNEFAGRKYATFYVNNVRFVKEGERLGGQSLMNRFAGVMGGASDHDPTHGLGSDIPV